MDIQNEKTYDAVFWAGVLGLTQYLVPLVNEAFGEHYRIMIERKISGLHHCPPSSFHRRTQHRMQQYLHLSANHTWH